MHGEPIFFQHFDGPFYPTLRILHRCECLAAEKKNPPPTPPLSSWLTLSLLPRDTVPDLLPRVGVDRGAIKFVLAGANIMWCVQKLPPLPLPCTRRH